MRRIVPEKVASIPGVCGTAMLHMERAAKLVAVLEALVFTARRAPGGLAVTLVPEASVDGVPLPWSLGLFLPGGPTSYLTIEGPAGTSALLLGAVPADVVELGVAQGDVLRKKIVSVLPP